MLGRVNCSGHDEEVVDAVGTQLLHSWSEIIMRRLSVPSKRLSTMSMYVDGMSVTSKDDLTD